LFKEFLKLIGLYNNTYEEEETDTPQIPNLENYIISESTDIKMIKSKYSYVKL
jgi:hypothetical protein